MASNKGKRSMDQSTRSALSSLEWALQQSIESPKRDDEFTVSEYCESLQNAGMEIGYRQAQARLDSMVEKKQLTKRKINIKGAQTSLFSKA
jgi:hypothetical protein